MIRDNAFDGVGTASFIGILPINSVVPNINSKAAALSTAIDTGEVGLAVVSFTGGEFINGSTNSTVGYGLSELTNLGQDTLDFLSTPAPTFNNSAANGGFVIYPNKINNNITRSVYSKET